MNRYVHAAVRNAEYCLSHQTANGWFPNCCLSDKERPLLHTIAYTMQGLLNIGKLTSRQDLIAGARKTADAEIDIMGSDDFFPAARMRSFTAR